ncbi:Origin recognition complex, subunit 1 [Podochytrium sp. JEL0797]|nr:Origin recognition complex, subunit 1 [Podochytrium sp. JEL0797]
MSGQAAKRRISLAASSDEDSEGFRSEDEGSAESGSDDASSADESESSDSEDQDDSDDSDAPRPAKKRRTVRHKTAKTAQLGASSKQRAATPLAVARQLLHVSHVPNALPCRESHFEHVYEYLAGAVAKRGGECVYISGVPGTGKTATVRQVIKTMQQEDDSLFQFIELNAMKLTDPSQVYCALYEHLFPTSPKVSAKHACDLLLDFFRGDATSKKPAKRVPIILLMDELDLLLTPSQTVLYNLFNYPRLPSSPLILIAIANTMDLPERVFSHKINSRVGAMRIAFEAYTADELAIIVGSRVLVSDTGGVLTIDAVTFCCKKVAGMSGDARRALDICRKSIEALELLQQKNDPELLAPHIDKTTGLAQVSRTLIMEIIRDMFSPTVVPFVKMGLSFHQKLFLLSIRKSCRKSGAADAPFEDVASEHKSFCQPLKESLPDTHLLSKIAMQLYASRLILLETGGKFTDPSQRVKLNVSEGDLMVALREDSKLKKILEKEQQL